MKTRIYVVDDHALIRQGLIALFSRESDIEVCGEAEHPDTALREIIMLQPDVVTVDIALKGALGLDLIKDICALNAKTRVLVLSMYDESLYALRVLQAGARGYVMKQEVMSKVTDAIRQIRAGQLYVSDYVAGEMLLRLVRGKTVDDSPTASLTDRELEVVNLIGAGMSTREIATKLRVSSKSIETYRASIKYKLHLTTATQLVQFCVRWVEENRMHACAMPAAR